MGLLILVVASVGLTALLFAYRSRISLEVAICRAQQRGAIPVENITVPEGRSVNINRFLDSLDGWAGHTYLQREDGTVYAGCYRAPVHSGPANGDAIYVDGVKVGPNQRVAIGPNSQIIQRERYSGKPALRYLQVTA
jgi:hypothetical protein